MSDENRLTYLKRFIKECDHKYYVKGESLIPDSQYDNLKRELVRLEEGTEIDEDSPTQTVGAPIESGHPHPHVIPLLSLENKFTIDEVMKEIGRIEKNLDDQEYVVQDKLDGLTGSLTYMDGNLRVTSTRGDGHVGETLSALDADVPKTVTDLATLDIVGEFVLPYDMLNLLNEEAESAGKKAYMSPRNAASGLIRKNIDKLTFIAFSARYHDGSRFADTEQELLDRLKSFGFNVVSSSRPIHSSQLGDILTNWSKSDDFDCDGLVVKVNDISVQEEMGNRKGSPRWGFAYKQNSNGEATVLRDVVWQVGCHGAVTPVGLVDPVLASKAMVSRATLHNPLMIMSLGLVLNGGVRLIRSGEVIPAIIGRAEEIDEDVKPIPIPSACPSCNTRLKPKGPELHCSNIQCPDRVIAQIIRIAGRDALDINGLGDVTASKLVKQGLVTKPSDLFKLTADVMIDAGFTKGTSVKVTNALGDIKVPLEKLYFALCIPKIGAGNAKILAKVYPSVKDLLNATPDGMLANTSLEMDEITSIYDYFEGDNIYDEWPVTIVDSVKRLNDTLPLRTWVITGTLETPRRVVEAKLNELNVEVSNRVGKNISCIVVGDKPTEHKVMRAKSMNIPIMTEADVHQWIKEQRGE